MKKICKITAVILCLLTLAVMAAPAFSGAAYIIVDGFKVSKKSDGTLEIAGCEDEGITSLVIPDKLYNNSVTSIASRAFADSAELKSVSLPSNLKVISSGAFSNCTALESVTIPDSVTSIGSNAFYGCSSLSHVDIGSSVASISGYTFNRCTSLTEVVIPDSVERIGQYAFFGCSKLESAEISQSVRLIDECAFYSCPVLTNVYIRSDNIEIHDTAFDDVYFNNLTIWGIPGSDSERYAKENSEGNTGITFNAYGEGDLNADMNVDGNDVTLCLKYIVGIIDETGLRVALADVNGDETVNIKDATIIQKRVIGA